MMDVDEVRQSVEWWEGETEVIRENMLQSYFVHPKSHMTGSGHVGFRVDKVALNDGCWRGAAVGGMMGRRDRSTQRKPAPELLCPP
jgi:hypothetical protein